MANSILNPTQIAREALRILHNKLSFIGSINRQYDGQFAKSGAKIGSQLKVRLPNKYTVRTGAVMSDQDTQETSETITLATQKGVDVNFSSFELTMNLDNFSKRILEPAMAVLAANIESDVFNVYKDVAHHVGTAGTAPNSLLTYLQARGKLNQYLAPKDNRRYVQINTDAMAASVDAFKSLFHDGNAVSKGFKEGELMRVAKLNFFENELVPVHTCGSRVATGALTVSGASQTGSSVLLTGGGTTTFKKGDVFTMAGCYAVHPETKVAYSFLQQFTVTADATASTTVTLSISPSIITTGAHQNVSASPTNSGAVVFTGTASTAYPMNLAYHEDAFTFVSADLEMPKGVDFAAREVYDGISMRIVKDYDIRNDQFPCRIDVLYGYKTLRNELACRILG